MSTRDIGHTRKQWKNRKSYRKSAMWSEKQTWTIIEIALPTNENIN
jgi:hypothetical protein